jgi:hypothetical protein
VHTHMVKLEVIYFSHCHSKEFKNLGGLFTIL